MSSTPSFIFGGRFQPPHMGHLSVVDHVIAEYDETPLIGIVNPDPVETWPGDGENFNEFIAEKNPLTYWERMTLFRKGLESSIVDGDIRAIVPLPRPSVNNKKADRFLPHGKKCFVLSKHSDADFESWKEKKYRENGYQVVKVDRSELGDVAQLASGTIIRNLAALGDSIWEAFVPDSTIPYLREIKFEERAGEHITERQALDSLKSFTKNHPKREFAAEMISQDLNIN